MNIQPKILIIDEQSDDRYLLAHFLRYCKYEVKEVELGNVHRIIDEVITFHPDFIILSDRSEPIDGYQLYSSLYEACKERLFFTIMLVDEIIDLTRTLAKRKGINQIVSRPRISDKEYSYFNITEFIHRNIVDIHIRKKI